MLVQEQKNNHKSFKDSGPSCPLYLISVSCALSCFHPTAVREMGHFYLGVFSSKNNRGTLFTISNVCHTDINKVLMRI